MKPRFVTVTPRKVAGRAPYGARGLKHGLWDKYVKPESRAPYGARGLKHARHPAALRFR